MGNGFAPEWLALREGADHRAINHDVRGNLLQRLAQRSVAHVVDLGSGTGSNFRSLAPEIKARQNWTLVDHDPRLLQFAGALTADAASSRILSIAFQEADLASGNLDNLISEAHLVTAAALFDLISPAVIERMVSSITKARCIFYTTLTYDGLASWLPETTLNPVLRDAFNAHQRTDKGFGAAAGPDATNVLASAFKSAGYRVMRGKSPWVLDQSLATLRQETDRGWAGAVQESGAISAEQATAWHTGRASDPDAVTIVGHEDLLAFPIAD